MHRPSFRLDACHDSLALAVVLLGAMYSPNAADRLATGAVMEHVESYVFSCLSSSSVGAEGCQGDPDSADGDMQEFQIIQAAFLMVITMFWTGTEVQKRRAATVRFDHVVEVRMACMDVVLKRRLMNFAT